MKNEYEIKRPRWLCDLLRFLPLKSQFVFSGNVRDLQHDSEKNVFHSLIVCLSRELITTGYSCVLCYYFVNGFKIVGSCVDEQNQHIIEAMTKKLELNFCNGYAAPDVRKFENILEKIISWEGDPIALIVDYASRLIINQNQLSDSEHKFFSRALIRSHESKFRPHGSLFKPFFNTVFWIVDKEGDMPDWMIVNNSRVRHILIPKPDHQIRRVLAGSLIQSLLGAKEAAEALQKSAIQNFVDNTEGLIFTDMMSIAQLCREDKLEYDKIGEAVRRYKVGVSEDPWRKINHDKIRNGQNFISERVKGQEHAIVHMLDIVKRAVTGIGTPRCGGRPRGVAFLAGPTGVGKTELAKSITSLLCGDESAYIRFDMSEFSAEHSDQRLIGAPPGYVGYDMGGELTNAIRDKPFSVVLFDEIEKAHPRILDKFLQILDDGVLTSGRGERVYFTESLIIFTSNLGLYQSSTTGERTPTVTVNDQFDTIKQRVRNEIDQYFKLTLNRPEILNRIGENIIIFDFIRDDIAEQIFNNMVNNVFVDIKRTQNIEITINSSALQTLKALCLMDMSNGGRGIRNKIETYLVNPLSRAVFDENIASNTNITIGSIESGLVTKISFINEVLEGAI